MAKSSHPLFVYPYEHQEHQRTTNKRHTPLVDMLNLVQTTIGILLTGIFGFILGNKIRNQ